MIKLKLIPGTQEWLDTRLANKTASEAPAMMGKHKNISRTQLLDHKKGWTTEVDAFTQKLFDAGHETEELARPLAEALLDDDDFYVEVGMLEGTDYLASFDGLSTLGDIVFEHKLYNKTLAENVRNNKLEPHYFWQLEHQLLVSGADKCLFVTSDGTTDNWADMYYVSVPSRRAELIAGWEQFAKDLENHEPQAKVEKVVADAVSVLPEINYTMNGLALTSDLDGFKSSAMALVEKSEQVMESDQDFANADSRQKVFTKAEKDIDGLCDKVLSEVADIDGFVKDLKVIKELIRTARLKEAKQLKSRKEVIRSEIASKANRDAIEFAHTLFNPMNLTPQNIGISIIENMKGKRTIDSLQDAANTALAHIKIELNAQAMNAKLNRHTLTHNAGYEFLFNDWSQIAFKANDDFIALVKSRISDYQKIEAEKAEAQRAQIQREEEAKAAAEKAEALRLERQNQATIEAKAQAKVAEIKEEEEVIKAVHSQETPAYMTTAPSKSVKKQQSSPLTAYDMGYIDGLTAYAKSGKEETLDVLIENYLQEKAA